jgi:hypothetical protein
MRFSQFLSDDVVVVFFVALILAVAGAGIAIRMASASDRHLDPRFDTCAEAQAHNYGPYRAGQDSEYGWYEDRNHDGTVCE